MKFLIVAVVVILALVKESSANCECFRSLNEYSCLCVRVTLTDQSDTLSELNIQHEEMGNNDVSLVEFRDSKIEYNSPEIVQIFQNVGKIILGGVGMKYLIPFDKCSKIHELSLYENEITSIEGEIFKKCTNLSILILDENQIEEINETSFRGLKNLTTLSMNSNLISKINQKIVEDLINLRILYLSENKIGFIPEKTFINLQNLEILDLSKNKILEIHSSAFEDLKSLQSLNLASNNLHQIHKEALKGLENLQDLFLAFNHLRTLDFGLPKIQRLVTLDFKENAISSIIHISLETLHRFVIYTWTEMFALMIILHRLAASKLKFCQS